MASDRSADVREPIALVYSSPSFSRLKLMDGCFLLSFTAHGCSMA